MAHDVAKQFEAGVQLHMAHKRSILAFSQATTEPEIQRLMSDTEEQGGAIIALELNVPEDVFDAMHAEACERLQMNSGAV